MGARNIYTIIDPNNPMRWRSPKDRENANAIQDAIAGHATTTTSTTSTTTTTTTTA